MKRCPIVSGVITKLSSEARDFLKKAITSFLGKEGPEEIVDAILELTLKN